MRYLRGEIMNCHEQPLSKFSRSVSLSVVIALLSVMYFPIHALAQPDPRINCSTYLGGSTTTCTNIMAPCVPMPPAIARAMFVAEDGFRNTYVAGFTNETDFPTTAGAYSRTTSVVCQTDGSDCVPRNYFLTKFDSAGRLVFSTFLQGGFALSAMTADSAGNVYLVGSNTNCTYCFRHYTALL